MTSSRDFLRSGLRLRARKIGSSVIMAKEKKTEERETSKSTSATKEEAVSIAAFTEDELEAFKENMASENTQFLSVEIPLQK